ncbi:hypothetical protein D2E26_0668 [Bifidobacterium dolichotidis]|uniref:Uncharacterized protein n=1 Tax=Bifidobacterium dolichotidis TaxID=2306976 RepID=A0A430FTF6_9BIFI|nr:hypothetical protein D2E26_0668 [Bifidobacterium dolichotidis]
MCMPATYLVGLHMEGCLACEPTMYPVELHLKRYFVMVMDLDVRSHHILGGFARRGANQVQHRHISGQNALLVG